MKEPTNEKDKNVVAVVRTNCHCKEEVVGHVQQKSLIVSMFLSLPQCALEIFATGKRVNHGGKYGLEIPANVLFHGGEKAIKLTKKNKVTKINENLNETLKNCLKMYTNFLHEMHFMACYWACPL